MRSINIIIITLMICVCIHVCICNTHVSRNKVVHRRSFFRRGHISTITKAKTTSATNAHKPKTTSNPGTTKLPTPMNSTSRGSNGIGVSRRTFADGPSDKLRSTAKTDVVTYNRPETSSSSSPTTNESAEDVTSSSSSPPSSSSSSLSSSSVMNSSPGDVNVSSYPSSSSSSSSSSLPLEVVTTSDLVTGHELPSPPTSSSSSSSSPSGDIQFDDMMTTTTMNNTSTSDADSFNTSSESSPPPSSSSSSSIEENDSETTHPPSSSSSSPSCSSALQSLVTSLLPSSSSELEPEMANATVEFWSESEDHDLTSFVKEVQNASPSEVTPDEISSSSSSSPLLSSSSSSPLLSSSSSSSPLLSSSSSSSSPLSDADSLIILNTEASNMAIKDASISTESSNASSSSSSSYDTPDPPNPSMGTEFPVANHTEAVISNATIHDFSTDSSPSSASPSSSSPTFNSSSYEIPSTDTSPRTTATTPSAIYPGTSSTEIDPGTTLPPYETITMMTTIMEIRSDGTTRLPEVKAPCVMSNLTTRPMNTSCVTLEWHSDPANCSSNYSVLVLGFGGFGFVDADDLVKEVVGLPHPGHVYEIRMISEDGYNVSVETHTVPERPHDLRRVNSTESEICFQWQQSDNTNNSNNNNYSFKVILDGDVRTDFEPARASASDWFGCLGNVDGPGTTRNISLAVVFRNTSSVESTLSVTTAPAPPEAIRVSRATESSFAITWSQRGHFDNVTLETDDAAGNATLLGVQCSNVNSSSSSCSAKVTDLPTPGKSYNFWLMAVVISNDGEKLSGLSQNFSVVTAPSRPKFIQHVNRSVDSFCFCFNQTGFATTFVLEVGGRGDLNFERSSDDSFVQLCASDLATPGSRYEVNVTARVGNVSSEKQSYRDWTAPAEPGKMTEIAGLKSTTSLCFEWTQRPKFTNFTCTYNNIDDDNKTDGSLRSCNNFSFEVRDDEQSPIHGCVGGLETPGQLYKIQIRAVIFDDSNASITSLNYTSFTGRTLPPRLKEPNCSTVTSSSLELLTFCPDDFVGSVGRSIVTELNSSIGSFLYDRSLDGNLCSKGVVTLTMDGLTGGVTYEARTRLVVDGVKGNWSEVARCTTNPPLLVNLTVTSTTTSLSVSWVPRGTSGYYDYVTVAACLDGSDCIMRNVSGPSHVTLDGLAPGALYPVKLITHLADNGASSNTTHYMLTVPTKPEIKSVNPSASSLDIQVEMNESHHCNLTFTLESERRKETVVNPCNGTRATFGGLSDDGSYRLRVYAFSDYTYVEAMLSKQSEESTRELFTLPSSVRGLNYSITGSNELTLRWHPPQNHVNIKSYRIRLNNEDKEVSLDCKNNLDCSGTELKYVFPNLDVDRSYNISVVPVNPGGSGEQEFLKAIIPSGTSFPGWGWAIIVCSIILLALLIFLLVWTRKRIIKPTRQAQPAGNLTTIMEMNRQVPPPIKIEDFPSEVDLKHKDSEYLFSREYECISETSPKHPITVAEKPENRVKNRFVDILAFDHSRVKLSTGEMTETGDINDYINANFIPGYFSRREYIACQGPMRSTIDHFWQMIWDQKASVVVMLTKLFEKGKEKCSQYWPDSEESQTYGEIQVKALTVSSLNYYELRTFQVTFGSETRQLHHFWFLNWPDFGVPVDEELLGCIKDVRQMTRPQSTVPQVVHCSAGVGRTGTYILLDRALHILERESYIDIFGMVKEMREFRCRMVQTEPQYIFVHDCIRGEILRNKTHEQEAVYINQSFTPEPLYINSGYAESRA